MNFHASLETKCRTKFVDETFMFYSIPDNFAVVGIERVLLDLPSCNIRGNVHQKALKGSSCEREGGRSCSVSLLRMWGERKLLLKLYFLTGVPVTFRACSLQACVRGCV